MTAIHVCLKSISYFRYSVSAFDFAPQVAFTYIYENIWICSSVECKRLHFWYTDSILTGDRVTTEGLLWLKSYWTLKCDWARCAVTLPAWLTTKETLMHKRDFPNWQTIFRVLFAQCSTLVVLTFSICFIFKSMSSVCQIKMLRYSNPE